MNGYMNHNMNLSNRVINIRFRHIIRTDEGGYGQRAIGVISEPGMSLSVGVEVYNPTLGLGYLHKLSDLRGIYISTTFRFPRPDRIFHTLKCVAHYSNEVSLHPDDADFLYTHERLYPSVVYRYTTDNRDELTSWEALQPSLRAKPMTAEEEHRWLNGNIILYTEGLVCKSSS